MLVQLHHQFGDVTELCVQRDIDTGPSQVQLTELVDEARRTHPLPEGAKWLLVGENSEFFVKVEAPQ